MDTTKLKADLKQVIEKFKKDLTGIRVGRATSQLVEDLKVDYYGGKSSLKQMAQINIPDARTIMITPWNKDHLVNVEKAINESDLNLAPSNNGEAVVLKLPPMTEDQRLELTKVVGKKAEECRVNVRQRREKSKEALNEQKKKVEISEDEYFKQEEALQNIMDEFMKEIDKIREKKENEITTL
ncbi:MAG: ribosome recycling factor [Patescibacteria group bacterium]|nr:ribosome recycling factor [Patescibacteria group bacterium]